MAIAKNEVPVGSLAIKIGNEIFPVTVQSKGGIDTSDATATATDILSPKTAYVDGKLVTGEIINNGDISESLEVGHTLKLDRGFYESISVSAVFSGGGYNIKELTITPSKEDQVFD